MSKKPLGRKNYGSIGHLPQSRTGPGDHHITQGQADICTVKKRDPHDTIIVQEKLDGSNVGVCKVEGQLYAITRAGYEAGTSPHEQHQEFARWVAVNVDRFDALLCEGERAVGEWMHTAHGTRYDLPHEPFVLLDLMIGNKREVLEDLAARNIIASGEPFVVPNTLSYGDSCSLEKALNLLGEHGAHGAIDPVEGLMYRVERNWLDKKTGERERVVDYLAKFVLPGKEDGKYLETVTGKEPILNTWPLT